MNWYKMLTSKSYRKHRWAAKNLKRLRAKGKTDITNLVETMIVFMALHHILEMFPNPDKELRLLEYEEAQLDITR